jgi:hypothetical protein
MSRRLMASLLIAIDSTIEAESYAARKGRTVSFSEESIERMAVSVYIQNSREGGVL